MIDKILEKEELTKDDLVALLSVEKEEELNKLFEKAYAIKEKYIGRVSHYRGLIEFSNYCIKDCKYCGIRKSNDLVDRFAMNKEEILKMAKWAFDNEYGSITLQSGERTDSKFVDFVTDVIQSIKDFSGGNLGMTLCMGEQSEEVYKRWFEAGGHRYLLRIETTNQNLYKNIHPQNDLHSFDKRVECLKSLRKIGYQVGTGVMMGIPNQTIEDLANDIIFFKDMDIDMIGMGPYIVHKDTPIGQYAIEQGLDTEENKKYRFLLGLKMIAVTRIFLKDVNIAATTALQALDPLGREKGIKAGANILMPIITLEDYREKYQLYDNKPCIDDNADKCKNCLTGRVMSVGEKVGFGEFGDSKHFFVKNKQKSYN
ncbi:MAG: [FeFe] hydrogenase H-cluster radical SAM maturase HydE [Lachnospirales bacterium]|nr:[FeFe] hydrogenase H-cluster radical SAM maturase HydE [Clostridiales bacterium]